MSATKRQNLPTQSEKAQQKRSGFSQRVKVVQAVAKITKRRAQSLPVRTSNKGECND